MDEQRVEPKVSPRAKRKNLPLESWIAPKSGVETDVELQALPVLDESGVISLGTERKRPSRSSFEGSIEVFIEGGRYVVHSPRPGEIGCQTGGPYLAIALDQARAYLQRHPEFYEQPQFEPVRLPIVGSWVA